MEKFLCRASASGLLMTNPKNKTDLLSKTTQSYLQEWTKEKIFRVRKEISNKKLDKGIEYEDIAIDKAIEWLDLPFALKNNKRFTDEFFTGEPDLLLSDTVIDIKNSWDCFTFPLFDTEIPTDGYYYQLQVYMYLTGLKNAKLVYVLLNTPETKYTPEIDYSNIDKKYKIKSFDFEYDEAVILKLIERVKESRIYINNLITQFYE